MNSIKLFPQLKIYRCIEQILNCLLIPIQSHKTTMALGFILSRTQVNVNNTQAAKPVL